MSIFYSPISAALLINSFRLLPALVSFTSNIYLYGHIYIINIDIRICFICIYYIETLFAVSRLVDWL